MGLLFRRNEPGLKELREWLGSLSPEDRGLIRSFIFGSSEQPSVEALGDGKIAAAIGNLLELFIKHGPELLSLIRAIIGLL